MTTDQELRKEFRKVDYQHRCGELSDKDYFDCILKVRDAAVKEERINTLKLVELGMREKVQYKDHHEYLDYLSEVIDSLQKEGTK